MKKIIAMTALGLGLLGACTGEFGALEGEAAYAKAGQVVEKYASNGACLQCYKKYSNVFEANKAYALSESGAFAAVGDRSTVQEAEGDALALCRTDPNYNDQKPCRLLMVNDRYVW